MSYVLRPKKHLNTEQVMYLAQPDINMNIMATGPTIGFWLVSPLVTSCVSHTLIATVSIAAVV
jgi:hypothetical protein